LSTTFPKGVLFMSIGSHIPVGFFGGNISPNIALPLHSCCRRYPWKHPRKSNRW
jgi:hypothetical protein